MLCNSDLSASLNSVFDLCFHILQCEWICVLKIFLLFCMYIWCYSCLSPPCLGTVLRSVCFSEMVLGHVFCYCSSFYGLPSASVFILFCQLLFTLWKDVLSLLCTALSCFWVYSFCQWLTIFCLLLFTFTIVHCLLLFLYYSSLSDSTVDICPLCFESTYCDSLILRWPNNFCFLHCAMAIILLISTTVFW
jgi:hypothetical protein